MKHILAWGAWICAILVLAPTKVWSHGFEGDRFFPPTIQTDDPFATDEFSITFQSFNDPAEGGDPKTREIDLSSEFDKEIFPKFALGISDTYINLEPSKHGFEAGAAPPSQDGFDDLSLSAKYQLWEVPEHEFIFSLGGEVDLGGTGSKPLGVESYSTYTPTLYFGKGFGDLPDSLKYFKPLALTGTLGLSIPGEASNADGSMNPDTLEWGLALEYSLPYLQQHVEDVGMPKPFSDFIPLVEFSMDSPLDRQGGTTTGTINPGVLWESNYCQIGAEAVIPVNGHTGPNVGCVVSIQIFIDDIFPKIFGHPLFGNDEGNETGPGPTP
jgi:hypothetical protein